MNTSLKMMNKSKHCLNETLEKTIQFIQYSQTSWADVEIKVWHWIKWEYSFCNETMNTSYALCGTTLNFIDSKCTNLLSTHNNQFSYQCLFFTLSTFYSNGIFPIKWEKLNNIRLFCNFIISFEFGIPISNQSSKTSSWQYFSSYVHCPSPNVKIFRLHNVLHIVENAQKLIFTLAPPFGRHFSFTRG